MWLEVDVYNGCGHRYLLCTAVCGCGCTASVCVGGAYHVRECVPVRTQLFVFLQSLLDGTVAEGKAHTEIQMKLYTPGTHRNRET